MTCAKAPMWSVIAPPQKALNGEITVLSLGLNGFVGGGSGARVWVKPTYSWSSLSLFPDSSAFR